MDEVVFGGAIKDGGRAMKDSRREHQRRNWSNWRFSKDGKSIHFVSYNDLYERAHKQRVIQDTLKYLHEVQEKMIEEVVSKSDMAESKTVLAHIMSK